MIKLGITTCIWKWYRYCLQKGWFKRHISKKIQATLSDKTQQKSNPTPIYIPATLSKTYLEAVLEYWKNVPPSYQDAEKGMYEVAKYLNIRTATIEDWNQLIKPLMDKVFDRTEFFHNPTSEFYTRLYLESFVWNCHLKEPLQWLIHRLTHDYNPVEKTTILESTQSIWIQRLLMNRTDSMTQVKSYKPILHISAPQWKAFLEHMHHFNMDWRDSLWTKFHFEKKWNAEQIRIEISPMTAGAYTLYPEKYHYAMACYGVVPGEKESQELHTLYQVYHHKKPFSSLTGILLAKYMIATRPEDWIENAPQEPLDIDGL